MRIRDVDQEPFNADIPLSPTKSSKVGVEKGIEYLSLEEDLEGVIPSSWLQRCCRRKVSVIAAGGSASAAISLVVLRFLKKIDQEPGITIADYLAGVGIQGFIEFAFSEFAKIEKEHTLPKASFIFLALTQLFLNLPSNSPAKDMILIFLTGYGGLHTASIFGAFADWRLGETSNGFTALDQRVTSIEFTGQPGSILEKVRHVGTGVIGITFITLGAVLSNNSRLYMDIGLNLSGNVVGALVQKVAKKKIEVAERAIQERVTEAAMNEELDVEVPTALRCTIIGYKITSVLSRGWLPGALVGANLSPLYFPAGFFTGFIEQEFRQKFQRGDFSRFKEEESVATSTFQTVSNVFKKCCAACSFGFVTWATVVDNPLADRLALISAGTGMASGWALTSIMRRIYDPRQSGKFKSLLYYSTHCAPAIFTLAMTVINNYHIGDESLTKYGAIRNGLADAAYFTFLFNVASSLTRRFKIGEDFGSTFLLTRMAMQKMVGNIA